MVLRVKAYRAALQALFNSISGSSSSADSGGQLSEEHAGKLSSRLDELLGEDVAGEALAQAGQVRRNEKGEVRVFASKIHSND